jgi:hypothetical protein
MRICLELFKKLSKFEVHITVFKSICLYKFFIMKTVQIEINKDQLMRLIHSLSEQGKLEVYDMLKKTLFLKRFNKLMGSTRNNRLKFYEITKEVESVRKKLYERKLTIKPG